MRRRPPPHPVAGFSLTELMITVLVLGIVMVAVFAAFLRSQRAAERVTAIAEARQGARAAVQLLERDVRMAGSGWGRIPVQGCNGGAPLTLYSINPGYNASSRCDSLLMVGGWDVMTTLRAAMATAADPIAVNSAAGFAAGDLCVVTNGVSAHLFQVTLVQSSPAVLQHDTSSPFNVAGGHLGWPAGGYGVSAQVYRTSWVSYRVDSTTYRRPCLVRWQLGGAPEMVAYNIYAFHIRYLLQDGTWTRNPADLSMVDKIVPVVETRPARAGQVVIADSVWAAIRPRTFY